MTDFQKYRGTKVEKTKKELEECGFVVHVEENFEKGENYPEKLVVDIKFIGDREIKIIAGVFKFLS